MGSKNIKTIQLIQPPIIYHSIRTEDQPLLPQGMTIIANVLHDEGYDVKILDINIDMKNLQASKQKSRSRVFPKVISKKQQAMIMRYIRAGKKSRFVETIIKRYKQTYPYDDAGVVGISVFDVAQFLWALFIAKIIENKNIPVIFGGAFFTTMGAVYFKEFSVMKYLIIGPGEPAICKFLKYLEGKSEISSIKGLVYKKDSEIIENKRGFYNIADTPAPGFEALDLAKYKMRINNRERVILPYQISAGCINHCNFCSDHKANVFQHKPLGKIIKELKMMIQTYGSNLIIFAESNFFFSYDFLDKFCDALLREGIDIIWGGMSGIIDARGRTMDKSLITKMKKSGCRFFYLGIETGSDSLRRNMGKNFTAKQAGEVLRNCSSLGINVTANFMVGYPYETKQDIAETIKFIRGYGKDITVASVSQFHIPYGSPMFCDPEKFGIKLAGMQKSRMFKPVYEFYEINGNSYRLKQRASAKSFRQISRVVYRCSIREHFRIKPYVPFWFYDAVKNIRAKNNRMTYCLNWILSICDKRHQNAYKYPYLLKFGLLEEPAGEDKADEYYSYSKHNPNAILPDS